MFRSHSILASIVALSMSAAAGFLLGQDNGKVVETAPTERDAAMILAGEQVRLVGFNCLVDEQLVTVLSYEEDFGLDCVEIRALDNSKGVVVEQS